jgi:hypothetical protein
VVQQQQQQQHKGYHSGRISGLDLELVLTAVLLLQVLRTSLLLLLPMAAQGIRMLADRWPTAAAAAAAVM